MDSSDRVSLEDLAEVRRALSVMSRRSLIAATAGGLIFSALAVVAWLWLHPGEPSTAVFLAVATYLLFGLPLLVRWLRHWRKIRRQLAAVEVKVRAGEVVYGSQVQFH
ncbi:hypothetical protein DSC_01740 [Pseudoxanthomonas spadix BD-a59]|jgi:membrane protein YdbS with pleckstrin-like domain|uniref:Uncharacterized protein n=1 Tax=Pseudoxanthomonas spadix (strain BD-a59) TaxID=1045855 RepID=G7UUB2_PSEUP|nr:hypothetical protein [Pseudoxanthomonas spadix]AER55001.1 hypothetical protein DSC_01740 [Pseudoxanthomonas spadix BD-a59]